MIKKFAALISFLAYDIFLIALAAVIIFFFLTLRDIQNITFILATLLSFGILVFSVLVGLILKPIAKERSPFKTDKKSIAESNRDFIQLVQEITGRKLPKNSTPVAEDISGLKYWLLVLFLLIVSFGFLFLTFLLSKK